MTSITLEETDEKTDHLSTAGHQSDRNISPSPSAAVIFSLHHTQRTYVATEQSENPLAHTGIAVPPNAVCQETKRECTETHEVVTSLNKLYQRFFLVWDRTNLTVQLNPVVEKEEVYDMKLVVSMATCLHMTNNT